MFRKIIPTFFVLSFSFLANGASWEEEVDGFVVRRLSDLRASRSLVKREKLGIGLATEILDFIIKGMDAYGGRTVSNSNHTAELIVDLSDVINLQSPDFKNRYDIFVEQWGGKGVQKPFSLHTFDKIAQAFRYRERIFSTDPDSAYSRWIEIIFREEIPSLYRTMHLIRDIESARGRDTGIPNSHKGYGFFHERTAEEQHLLIISGHLDKIAISSGAEKERRKVLVKRTVPCCSLGGLSDLTTMAQDYFALERLETAAEMIIAITSHSSVTRRRSFLAGMVQIGELATNKKLSNFVKYHAERVPWKDLVHIRDAIEHQDENGFLSFFEDFIEGIESSVSLMAWREELKTLKTQVKEVREILWKDDPKTTYDSWIEAELAGRPVYGVVKGVDIVPVNKSFKDTFKNTDVFRFRKREWNEVLNAKRKVEFRDLFQINQLLESDQIRELREELSSYVRIRQEFYQMMRRGQVQYIGPFNDINKKILKKQKYLSDLEGIQAYLYERLKREAIHLTEEEKDLLIQTISSNLDKEIVVKICLGLLSRDKDVLDPKNGRAFIKAFTDNGFDYTPYGQIYTKIHPVMHLTRKVAGTLRYDPSKDMDQTARRAFSLGKLGEVLTYFHGMTTDIPTIFRFLSQNMVEQKSTLMAMQFAIARNFGETSPEAVFLRRIAMAQGCEIAIGFAPGFPAVGARTLLNRICRALNLMEFNPLEISRDPEYRAFTEKESENMFRLIREVKLPMAITKEPANYLASVYALSVGLGSFKTWLSKEPSPLADEVSVFEKLRDARNFIAHGDILREMHNIGLAKVQIEALKRYLDTCRALGVSQ